MNADLIFTLDEIRHHADGRTELIFMQKAWRFGCQRERRQVQADNRGGWALGADYIEINGVWRRENE